MGVASNQTHGKQVQFFSVVDLVNSLEREKVASKQGKLALSLMQIDFVVLDGIVYFSFSQASGPGCFICCHDYMNAPLLLLKPIKASCVLYPT